MFVAEFNPITTKHLSEILPPEVDGLSRKSTENLLNISTTTCWRYLTCLIEKRPKGFDYMASNQYLTRGSIAALYQFKQLVEKFQYEGAVPRINEHMERYYGI
ncbi:hypothetical protein H6G36_25635 [Anabaena minutissima FACHB-250]|nr:hypothetical protein [Anabaena minutissima FACHB-250]